MVVPVNPLDRHSLRHRVDAALSAFLDRQGAALIAMSPGAGAAADRAARVPGRRQADAPGVLLLGLARSAGDSATRREDGIVHAAASLELLQASALIHDDYMDGSDTRRGMPAIHRRFAAAHREAGWEGSGARFGAAPRSCSATCA